MIKAMSNDNTHIDDIFSQPDLPSTQELMEYVDGNLDRQRSREIEMLMVDDPGINATVEAIEAVGTQAYQNTRNSLDHRLQQRLAQLETQTHAPKTSKEAKVISFLRPKSLVAMAAAVILLAIVGFYGFQNDPSMQDIANTHFTAQAPLTVRGAQQFLAISTSKAQLMAGDSFYQLGEYQKAIESYKNTIALNKVTRDEAEFKLAMSHLQLNQEKEAKDLLLTISGNKLHGYHQQAADALADL